MVDFALGLLVKKLFGAKNLNFAKFWTCNLMLLLFCVNLTFGKSHHLLPEKSPYSSTQNQEYTVFCSQKGVTYSQGYISHAKQVAA